jgi:hypothetical protein
MAEPPYSTTQWAPPSWPAPPPPPPGSRPPGPPGSDRPFSIAWLALAALVLGVSVVAGVVGVRVVREVVSSEATGERLTAAPPPADGTLPEDLYVTPSNGEVIDGASAERVVRAAWSTREYALINEDYELLSRIETGAALAVDAECRCGAAPFASGGGVIWSYAAPADQSYPAWFLAEVRAADGSPGWSRAIFGGDQPMSLFLVFERAAATDPWLIRVANDAPFGEPLLPPPDDDMLRSAPIDPNLAMARPRGAARYIQQYMDTGRGSGGPYDDTLLATIAREAIENEAALEGEGGEFGAWYRAAEPVNGLVLPDGQEFVCAQLEGYVERNAPAGSGLLVQPTDRSTFGFQLEPGEYVRIGRHSLRQYCWIDSEESAGWMIGGAGGVTSTVGTLDG